jgi:threonylcarbamoyladenosine tRNA methylthiotransferase MtaB
MKKAAVATLGCKVNQVESGAIIEQLINMGFKIVDITKEADIYIINTCTVTNKSDYKSRNLIKHALQKKQDNPQVKVIVTGCYAQKEREEIASLGEIDLIVDNQSKVDLSVWFSKPDYEFRDIQKAVDFSWHQVDNMHGKTRAFIKIQDGCDYYCSYCAVPYGRGKPRSLEFEKVINQAVHLVQNGYKEIVLSGVNLGLYRDKSEGKSLTDVVKYLNDIAGLMLLRLSSIEPDLWNDQLLMAILESDKICPHFHIPLQSGSDTVLKRMKRKYSVKTAQQLINNLQANKPMSAIGLDVICGFPGETDAEFEETFNLMKLLPISYLHVFGYSQRRGTPASTMVAQVRGETIKERVHKLTELSKTMKSDYMNQLIEKETLISGIVESKTGDIGTALSDHYLRLYVKSKSVSENDYVKGKAIRQYKDGVLVQLP